MGVAPLSEREGDNRIPWGVSPTPGHPAYEYINI